MSEIILLNDFTCNETRLHNADWFNRMIALGSIQRYTVYIKERMFFLEFSTYVLILQAFFTEIGKTSISKGNNSFKNDCWPPKDVI